MVTIVPIAQAREDKRGYDEINDVIARACGTIANVNDPTDLRLSKDGELPLHDAVPFAAANPAAVAGLDDRGEVVAGKRADLIAVRNRAGQPQVEGTRSRGAAVFTNGATFAAPGRRC